MGLVESLPVQRVRPVLFLPLWLGTLRDAISGAAGAVSGAPAWRQSGSVDAVWPVDGSARLTYTEAPSMLVSESTFFLSTDGIENGSQILLDRGGIANTRLQLGNGTLTMWGGSVASTEVASYDGAKTLAVTVNPGTPANFYTDGSFLGPGTNSITLGSGAGDLLLLSASGSNMIGAMRCFAIYPAVLTPAEILSLHNWSQKRITPRKQWSGSPRSTGLVFQDNIQSARVTLANETSGKLSNTDYEIQSGTWAVNEDSATGERYIECVAAGIISRRNLEAYGTTEFGFYKHNEAASNVQFLGYDLAATGSGYDIGLRADLAIELVRTGAVTLARTAPNYIAIDTKYTLRTTRGTLGEFTIYIKGGAFTSWTLVDMSAVGSNPVTNNVWTTNQYWIADLDAGDRLYLDRQHSTVKAP